MVNQAVRTKTRVWGISGQIGSGKSTLGKTLEKYGAVNIEVDSIGYQVLEEPSIREKLIEVFGEKILNEDGKVCRKPLGKTAFSESESTRMLNSIVHPPMIEKVKAVLAGEVARNTPLVIINAALLFSMGLNPLCDLIIYLKAFTNLRLQRIVSYRKIPIESAKARLKAQDPEPSPASNIIIFENNGSISEMENWAKKNLIPRLNGKRK